MTIKYFALALFLLPLHGQEAPNRFKKTPDLPKNPNDLPVIVVNHIEHFVVAKETLHHWRASHPDQNMTHDLVSNWIDQDQASLAETFFLSTRLEENLALNAGCSLTYPVQYVPPKFSGEWSIPDAFDHKILGNHIKTIFRQDDRQQLLASLTFGEAQLSGSDSHSAFIEETRSPDDLFMPVFKTFRQWCEMTYVEGATHLTGIFNLLGDDTKSLVIFSKAGSVTLDPIPKDEQAADSSKAITVSSELIEVSFEIWTDYCRDKTPDQLRSGTATWAGSLLQEQKAIRLKALSKEASWGEKNDLNPDAEGASYPQSYKPSDPSKKLSPSNLLVPTEMESGFHDFVLQVTPESTLSGHILLSYVWQMHTPREKYVIHRVSDGEKWIPDAWAPCLSFFNLDGAVFLNPGENTLVGALPVESDPPNRSAAKVRLFFLKAE